MRVEYEIIFFPIIFYLLLFFLSHGYSNITIKDFFFFKQYKARIAKQTYQLTFCDIKLLVIEISKNTCQS